MFKRLLTKTNLILFLAGIMIIVGIGMVYSSDSSLSSSEHVWKEYVNTNLDFAVAYPIDVSQPQEVTHPPTNNGFPGAEVVNFYDASNVTYLSVWTQETNAADAREWFKEVYGTNGNGYYISATSTVDGVSAVGVSEKVPSKARDGYDLSFVHDDKAYSLHIDDSQLTQEEVEYVRNSFRFLSWWERL